MDRQTDQELIETLKHALEMYEMDTDNDYLLAKAVKAALQELTARSEV